MSRLKPVPSWTDPSPEGEPGTVECDGLHPPLSGERPTMDLTSAELFVLASLRTWVAPLRAPGRQHPHWQEIMRLGGASVRTALAFDRIMFTLTSAAQRSLDVRCPACSSLGADEEAMLALVTSLQGGDAVTALRILIDWLPGDIAGATLGHARAFAAGCTEVGINVPFALPTRARGATLH